MAEEPAQQCYRAVIRGPHTWKASPPDPNVNSLMTPSALVIEPKTSLAVVNQGLVEIPNLCINSDQKHNPQILSVVFFPTQEIAQEALHVFTKAMEIDDCIYDICKNGKVVGVLKLALGSFCVPLDVVVNRTKFTAGNASNPKKVTGTPCSNVGGRSNSDVGANENCDSYHLRVTVSPSASLLQKKETDLYEVIRKSVQMQGGNTNRLSLVFFKLDKRTPIAKSRTPLILFSRSNTNYPPQKPTPTIYTRSKTAVLSVKEASQSLKPEFIGGFGKKNVIGAPKFGKELFIKRLDTHTVPVQGDGVPNALNTGSSGATRHRDTVLLPNVGSLETAAATIDTLVDVGSHKRATSAHEHISSREDGDVLVTSLANPKFKGIDVGALLKHKEGTLNSNVPKGNRAKIKGEASPNESRNLKPKLEEMQQKHKKELENQKAQFEQQYNKLRLEHEASIASMLSNHGTIVKGLEEQLRVTNQQLQNVMSDADKNTRERIQAVDALENELKLLQSKSQSTIETLQHTLELESKNKQGLVDMTRHLQQEYEELKQAMAYSNLDYNRRINELEDANQRLAQDLKAQGTLTKDALECEGEIKSKYEALVDQTRASAEKEQYLSSELQRLKTQNAQIDAQRQVLLEKSNEEINEWINKYKEAIEEIDLVKKREVTLMVEIDKLREQNKQLSQNLKLQQEAHIASMGALEQDAKSEWAAMYQQAKAAADSLQNQRSELYLELEDVKKRNQQLEDELQAQFNSARDAISENNAWISKYKSALDDVDSLRRSETDLTAELSRCKCALQQKTLEFEVLQKSTLETHALEVKRLESLNLKATSELGTTKSQNTDLQNRLAEALAELAHLRDVNNSMSSADEHLRLELRQFKDRIAQVECQGKAKEQELGKLRSVFDELKTNYEKLCKEHEGTIKSLKEARETLQQQSALVAHLEQEKHLLESNSFEKQTLLIRLQESIDSHINDKLINENERFKLQEQLKALEKKYEELVESFNKSTSELEACRLEKEQLVEKLNRALERCHTLQKELTSANETIARQRDVDILGLNKANQQLELKLRERDGTIANLTHVNTLYKLFRARYTLTTGCLVHRIQIKEKALARLAELLVVIKARCASLKCLQRNTEANQIKQAKDSKDYIKERDAWIARKMAEFEKLKLLHMHSNNRTQSQSQSQLQSESQSSNSQTLKLDSIIRDLKRVLSNQQKFGKDLNVLLTSANDGHFARKGDAGPLEQRKSHNGSGENGQYATVSPSRLLNYGKHDLSQLETMSSFGRDLPNSSLSAANYRENRAFVLRRTHVERTRASAQCSEDRL